MKDWFHDKSVEPKPLSKTEPLEVNVGVDESMFVTCLPSPRNTLDRLRRNSQSSGCSGSSKSASESIGSAKKVISVVSVVWETKLTVHTRVYLSIFCLHKQS